MSHRGTSFGVVVEDRDDPTVLRLEGEFDMVSAPDLLAAANDVLGRGEPNLVLDLSELSFLDSTGISTLLLLSRKAAALGGSVTLRSPSQRVQQVLRISGLTGYFAQD